MMSISGNVPSWNNLSSAIAVNKQLGGTYIVVLSMRKYKMFFLMNNRLHIHTIPSTMCLCEIVVDDTARPFIDFDYDVEDELEIITSTLIQYFKRQYDVDTTVEWKWSYNSERRWHCVISGIYFLNCWVAGCIKMVTALKQIIPQLIVDNSVYRCNSSFRMVTQSKYQDGEYVKVLHPYRKCNMDALFITHTPSDIGVPVKIEIHDTVTCNIIAYETNNIESCFNIPQGLRFDRIIRVYCNYKIIRLLRYAPSLCILCNRVHTSDNAYLIVGTYTVEFRCYRKPVDSSGKIISNVYMR
jgi:hypothetical protein